MAYKILIVDDEKMMTELLSDHLRDCDYETITANDSREAKMPQNWKTVRGEHT